MEMDAVWLFLREKGIIVLSAVVSLFAFIANPVINLIYPPLEAFIPAAVTPPAAAEKTLSIEGWGIFYDAGAIPAEKTAAETLAATLSQITGLSYAVSDAAPAVPGNFLVGKAAGLDVSELGADGYIIKMDGGNILIAGGEPRGTLYGVYNFLMKYFDCRWYAADLQVIPPGPAALAPVEDEAFAPPISEFRDMGFLNTLDRTFSVANGLNGTRWHSGFPAEWGGSYGYNGNFCHSMLNQFFPASAYFAGHQDWYAYRESSKKREPTQLCLTNEALLAEMKLKVRALLADGNGQPVVTVTQMDNEEYCQCPNCKAVDAEEGSHMGTMLRFVNAVAADIAEDYPDALIDTFAYQYTRALPKTVRPLPNVIVRLCSIECCFAHPLDDPACPENLKFMEDIKAWSEVCDRLYIWDYTINFFHTNCVFPNFRVLQKNMRIFARYGATGVYEDGYIDGGDSEFARLRGYLLARLLYNPDIDCEAEMDGFLEACYGGGWQYIREFIRLACENTAKPDCLGRHTGLTFWMSANEKAILDLKPNQVSYADELWEKAIELAGSEACKRNVQSSQISWRYWKACNRKAEFSWLNKPGEWTVANEQLYDDLKGLGIAYRGVGDLFKADPNWYDTPIEWR